MTRITEGLVGCMLSSMVLECIGPIVAGCVWVLGMKVMAWGPTLDVARADSGTRIGADAGLDFFGQFRARGDRRSGRASGGAQR